jgi:hypothetical protein
MPDSASSDIPLTVNLRTYFIKLSTGFAVDQVRSFETSQYLSESTVLSFYVSSLSTSIGLGTANLFSTRCQINVSSSLPVTSDDSRPSWLHKVGLWEIRKGL